jgi:hypothetical protein
MEKETPEQLRKAAKGVRRPSRRKPRPRRKRLPCRWLLTPAGEAFARRIARVRQRQPEVLPPKRVKSSG